MSDNFENMQNNDGYSSYRFTNPDALESGLTETEKWESGPTAESTDDLFAGNETVADSVDNREPEKEDRVQPIVAETWWGDSAETAGYKQEGMKEKEEKQDSLKQEEKSDSTYAYCFKRVTTDSENNRTNTGYNNNTTRANTTETNPTETNPTGNRASNDFDAWNRQDTWNRQTTPVKPVVPQKTKRKKKTKSTFGKIVSCIGFAALFGLVAGGVFLGVSAAGTNLLGLNKPEQHQEAPAVPSVDAIAPTIEAVGENTADAAKEGSVSSVTNTSGDLTVAQVAERCMPAMVAITNTSITEVPYYFGFGGFQNYESTSSGSGIIVDQNENEILIATNNHVVSGANALTVAFVDETLVEATIKGTDASNDLAVVSVKLSDIPEETLAQIRVIEIGDSNELSVGDQVVAIGNALGYGQSVSSGWISALNREVVIDNMTLNLIQTDAAINPGNSGGALLNMKGQLIAINESKYADTNVEGMGYAIPVSTATPILAEIMSKETRYKVDEAQASYLGISCIDIATEYAAMYGVPTGVYVESVEVNGPAASAGIKKGDIITKFDGTTLTNYNELTSMLEYYAAGELVEVTIARADDGEYKERNVMVTLGARNESDFIKGITE